MLLSLSLSLYSCNDFGSSCIFHHLLFTPFLLYLFLYCLSISATSLYPFSIFLTSIFYNFFRFCTYFCFSFTILKRIKQQFFFSLSVTIEYFCKICYTYSSCFESCIYLHKRQTRPNCSNYYKTHMRLQNTQT